MQQHGSTLWLDLGDGTEAKSKLFQNMVILHIKLNGDMQQHGSNNLPADPQSRGGIKSAESNFFQKIILLHIKLKEMTHAASL